MRSLPRKDPKLLLTPMEEKKASINEGKKKQKKF